MAESDRVGVCQWLNSKLVALRTVLLEFVVAVVAEVVAEQAKEDAEIVGSWAFVDSLGIVDSLVEICWALVQAFR